MRLGIATDDGGFGVKEELVARIRAAGHEVVDFGAHSLNPDDDYPDYVVPLGQAVVAGKVDRGVAICGSGVGRVGLREQSKRRPRLSHSRSFLCEARRRGRSHEHPLHGRTNRWPGSRLRSRPNLSRREYSSAPRHLHRLGKVAALNLERRTP